MAFLITPVKLWLYSGESQTEASERAMVALKASTDPVGVRGLLFVVHRQAQLPQVDQLGAVAGRLCPLRQEARWIEAAPVAPDAAQDHRDEQAGAGRLQGPCLVQ